MNGKAGLGKDVNRSISVISGIAAVLTAGLSGGALLYQKFKPAPPPPPIPVLQSYTSASVGGGHSPMEFCTPILEAYRVKYPDFVINVRTSETSSKDFFGHVTYHYNCNFDATPKTRR